MHIVCEEDAAHIDIVMIDGEFSVLHMAVAEEEDHGPSSWGFSLKELVQKQAEDKELTVLLNWLKTKEEPGQAAIYL